MRGVYFYLIVWFCFIYQNKSANGFTLPFSSFSSKVVPRRPTNSSVATVNKLPSVTTSISTKDTKNEVLSDLKYEDNDVTASMGVQSVVPFILSPSSSISNAVPQTRAPTNTILTSESVYDCTPINNFDKRATSNQASRLGVPTSPYIISPSDTNFIMPVVPEDFLANSAPDGSRLSLGNCIDNLATFLSPQNLPTTTVLNNGLLAKDINLNTLPATVLDTSTSPQVNTKSDFISAVPLEGLLPENIIPSASIPCTQLPILNCNNLASLENRQIQDVNLISSSINSVKPVPKSHLDPSIGSTTNSLLQPDSLLTSPMAPSTPKLPSNSINQAKPTFKVNPKSLDLKIMPLPPQTDVSPLQGVVRPLKRNKTSSSFNTCSSPNSSLLPQKSSLSQAPIEQSLRQMPSTDFSSLPTQQTSPFKEKESIQQSSSIKSLPVSQPLNLIANPLNAASLRISPETVSSFEPQKSSLPSSNKLSSQPVDFRSNSLNGPSLVIPRQPLSFGSQITPLPTASKLPSIDCLTIQEIPCSFLQPLSSTPSSLKPLNSASTPLQSTASKLPSLDCPTMQLQPSSMQQPLLPSSGVIPLNSACTPLKSTNLPSFIPLYDPSFAYLSPIRYSETSPLNASNTSLQQSLETLRLGDYLLLSPETLSRLQNLPLTILPPVTLDQINLLKYSSFDPKLSSSQNSLVCNPHPSSNLLLSPQTSNPTVTKETLNTAKSLPVSNAFKSVPKIPRPNQLPTSKPNFNTFNVSPQSSLLPKQINIPTSDLASLLQEPFRKLTPVLNAPELISLQAATPVGTSYNVLSSSMTAPLSSNLLNNRLISPSVDISKPLPISPSFGVSKKPDITSNSFTYPSNNINPLFTSTLSHSLSPIGSFNNANLLESNVFSTQTPQILSPVNIDKSVTSVSPTVSFLSPDTNKLAKEQTIPLSSSKSNIASTPKVNSPVLYSDRNNPQIQPSDFIIDRCVNNLVPLFTINNLLEIIYNPSLIPSSANINTLPEVLSLPQINQSSYSISPPLSSPTLPPLSCSNLPIPSPSPNLNPLSKSLNGYNFVPSSEPSFVTNINCPTIASKNPICSSPGKFITKPTSIITSDSLPCNHQMLINPYSNLASNPAILSQSDAILDTKVIDTYFPNLQPICIPSSSDYTTNTAPIFTESNSGSDNSSPLSNFASKLTNTLLISTLSNLTFPNSRRSLPSIQTIPVVSLPKTKPALRRKSKSKRKSSSNSKSKYSSRSNSMVASPSEANPTFAEPTLSSNSSLSSINSSVLHNSSKNSSVDVQNDSLTMSSVAVDSILTKPTSLEPLNNEFCNIQSPSSLPSPNIIKRSSSSSNVKKDDLKNPEEIVEYIVLKELLNSDSISNWDLLEKIIDILCEK